jgi:hypothetical protein
MKGNLNVIEIEEHSLGRKQKLPRVSDVLGIFNIVRIGKQNVFVIYIFFSF